MERHEDLRTDRRAGGTAELEELELELEFEPIGQVRFIIVIIEVGDRGLATGSVIVGSNRTSLLPSHYTVPYDQVRTSRSSPRSIAE